MPTLGTGLGLVSPPRTILFAPSILSVTQLNISTTTPYSSLTFAGHNSTTGNVLVLLASRNTVNSPQGFSGVTWGGSALTGVLDIELANPPSASGSAVGWLGYINAGPTGGQNVVVTPTAAEFNDLIGWALTFDRTISVGGSTNGAVVRVVQGAYSATITPGNAASLLLALVAVNDENLSPLSISADWSLRDQDKTGNSGAGDIAAVLASKTSGSTTLQTMTASTGGALTTDDWLAIAVELLPT